MWLYINVALKQRMNNAFPPLKQTTFSWRTNTYYKVRLQSLLNNALNVMSPQRV